MLTLALESYKDQCNLWPESGRCILAQADDHSVVVYQAYRPSIGKYAVENQKFGGEFSLNRMSWIKPNFLWMMYRSGWGTKEGQEKTLAIWLKRDAFNTILSQAVYSSFQPDIYVNREAWSTAVATSEVRLQWDPDHDPHGSKLERRAIQLGLKGSVLKQYAEEWIVKIEDISEFVATQRGNLSNIGELLTPKERVYPVSDITVSDHLQLSV